MKVTNYYPDADTLLFATKHWRIMVWRDENEKTCVSVLDLKEGSSTDYILGEETETQIL